MTNYAELIDKLYRAAGEDDWSNLEDADLVEAADALARAEARARLTVVPADAETTAEDREQLQHDLETRGYHTNREAIKAILRDLARAEARARLTVVPADAETTQEEREEWKIKSDVQFALWKEGVAPTLVDKTVWSFIPRLLRDLARAEARAAARAEAAEKALAEVRNMAMGDALGRTQRIIQFIEQFQARSQQ